VESRLELVVGQLLVDFQRRMAALNINYAELARRLGLSRARVSELFSGRQNPTIGTLMKVAEALGCYLRIELALLDSLSSARITDRDSGPGRWNSSPVLRVSAQDAVARNMNRRR